MECTWVLDRYCPVCTRHAGQMSYEGIRCDLVTLSTLLLWVVLAMASTFHVAETEVASSVSAMTSLISQEEKLIEHLGKVLDLARAKRENGTWIARIKRYLDCIEAKHRSLAARTLGNLAHPIIGFRLVRRLDREWNDVTGLMGQAQSHLENAHALYDNLRSMKDVFTRWTKWPQRQDVKDAAMSLIRIASTYDLYPRTRGSHHNDSGTVQYGHDESETVPESPTYFGGRDEAILTTGREAFRRYRDGVDDGYSRRVDNSTIVRCDYNCDDRGYSERLGVQRHHHDNEIKTSNIDNNNDNDNHDTKDYDSSINYNHDNNNNNNNNNGNVKSSDNIESSKPTPSNNKSHVDDKQSCDYRYTWLDVQDFVYIINTAISQSLRDEARRWFHLLEKDLLYHGDNQGYKSKMDKLFERIQAMDTKDRGEDEVMRKYVHLCRQASEVDSTPQTPVPPNLSCSWRHSHPYLRYKVELLHISPDIYQFHDVIESQEIEHIKDRGRVKLVPSALNIEDSKKNDARYWRVSQTAWFRDETPVLQRLSERVGHLTGLDTGMVTDPRGQLDTVYSEPLQVVNYGLGGLYGPHLDTLHSANPESGTHTQHTGDRLATWMFYIGDVQIGGATVFPLINVSVKPIKGSAILWYNLLRNGQVDKRTVHAGCPVVIGDKWVANKWVRDTAQWKTRPCLLDPTL